MFKLILGKIAKMVSRNVNSAFFITLNTENYKEVYDITKDPIQSSKIMKDLGIEGTKESAERQESIFKIFPDDPKKVLELLPSAIYQIIFGAKMDDYEQYEEKLEESDYPAVIFKLNRSSVCGGFGSSNEFNIDFSKNVPKYNGCGAGVVGMLQEVANYVLYVKGSPYRIDITERKCFNAGDKCMELYCMVIPSDKFGIMTQEEAEKAKQSKKGFNLDLNKIEEFLTKPIAAIREQISKIVQEKMNMNPKEFLEHFRNYEQDAIRILGFLLIHLLNEPGRIIEKAAKNETYSKIIGHGYNTMIEMTKLYIPKEVISDYHKLFIDFITDLASEEMVNTFRKITPSDFVSLFFEGVKKALQDLGINFQGLKSNIWEELEMQKIVDKIPIKNQEDISEEERIRLSEIKLKIIEEFFLLISAVLSLPTQIVISSSHATAKAIATSGGDIFSNVREHTELLLDLVEKLK
jgi:hypothetical protein